MSKIKDWFKINDTINKKKVRLVLIIGCLMGVAGIAVVSAQMSDSTAEEGESNYGGSAAFFGKSPKELKAEAERKAKEEAEAQAAAEAEARAKAEATKKLKTTKSTVTEEVSEEVADDGDFIEVEVEVPATKTKTTKPTSTSSTPTKTDAEKSRSSTKSEKPVEEQDYMRGY